MTDRQPDDLTRWPRKFIWACGEPTTACALEDELFARFELTAQQYNVLRLLKAARPETVPTLSLVERLDLSSAGCDAND